MFTFIYSPRVGTPAAKMPDPYTRAQKQVRLTRSSPANAISEQNTTVPGATCSVLVGRADVSGATIRSRRRTKGGRLVHMRGDEALVGQFVDVKITGSNTWALYGEEA